MKIGHVIFGWVAGVITLLAILAAWSRVSQMKESPTYVKNAFDAFSKLFNGAFGY